MLCKDIIIQIYDFKGSDGTRELCGTIEFDHMDTDTIGDLMYQLLKKSNCLFGNAIAEVTFKMEQP